MNVIEKLRSNGITINFSELTSIADRYSIKEISVFGSSIRSDMKPESDIDLLISFTSSADISLFDLMDLENELEKIFLRHVDIVEPRSLTNPIRRESILTSRELLYAS